MPIKVGDKAPDFQLFSAEQNEVKLSDHQGKNVVLLFFPLAFTGVCTTELCTMRDDIAYYQGLDADIISLSVDAVPTLKKFKDEQKLNFPLLSDFNKEVSRAYDVLHEAFGWGMKGVSKRSAFVIDKAGTVQYAEVLDNPGELPNFAAIKETLSNLN